MITSLLGCICGHSTEMNACGPKPPSATTSNTWQNKPLYCIPIMETLWHVSFYCIKIQQISVWVTCTLSGLQMSIGIFRKEFQKLCWRPVFYSYSINRRAQNVALKQHPPLSIFIAVSALWHLGFQSYAVLWDVVKGNITWLKLMLLLC